MSDYEFLWLIRRLTLLKGQKRDQAIGMANREIKAAHQEWAIQTIDRAHEYITHHGTRRQRCWLVWSAQGWRRI